MSIYKQISLLALPIALHAMLFASMGFIDTWMLSSLGAETIAAAGIGSRLFWFCGNLVIGVSGAVAVFAAQYWGANNRTGVQKSMHLGVCYGVLIALIAVPIVWFGAEGITQGMSENRDVADLARGYIQITIFSLFISAFSVVWAAGFRAIQQPKVVLYLFVFELLLNVLLNYVLIFGHWGAPELGLNGAAYATLAARCCAALLTGGIIRWFAAAEKPNNEGWQALRLSFGACRVFFRWSENKPFLLLMLPIMAGELIWSGGIVTYHTIYGNISSTALAAISILAPLELLIGSFIWGCSAAVGTLVGEKIGANQRDQVNRYVRAGIISAMLLGATLGLLLWLGREVVLTVFDSAGEEVRNTVLTLLPLMLVSIFLRAITMTAMGGILKSGGDTRFITGLDFCAQWLGAVPLSLLLAFYFKLPVEYVYCAVILEELIKLIPVFYRIRSGRWIKDLGRSESSDVAPEGSTEEHKSKTLQTA